MSRGNNASVAHLLLSYRLRAGLGQRELADRAGLSERALRNIERQRTRAPRWETVRRLADELRLPGAERERLFAAVSEPSGRSLLRVGILGPVALWHGAQPAASGPRISLRLLGALALRPRRSVPHDQLVDLLWDDRPPRSAHSLVHTHVARLRSLLGNGARDQIDIVVRTSDGYRLDLDDGQVDLTRFEQLIDEARALEPGEAVGRYQEALALWRGPVLLDGGDRLRGHPDAVAAGTRRLTAVIDGADLALSQGQPEQALTWLRAVLPEAPLHEGLHARLVLALGRSRQTAAALDHYAAVRGRLADELGVDPDAELQRAYLTVLRQDHPEPVPRPVRQALPAQLPLDVRGFAGRPEELTQLDAILADAALVVVTGTAGVGKTALAVHWAHRVRRHFPDGQLYVNLRGFDAGGSALRPQQAVRGFLEALGVPRDRQPAELDAQIGLYRSLLAAGRMLVVLDNARDAAQVRPLLPGSPGCLVVVTSRDQLAGLIAAEGAHLVTLDLMSTSEARWMLTRRLGRERVAAEPAAVDEIIARCARLPLALSIVASRAATRPRVALATLANELRGGDRLDALDGGEAATDVRAAFSWSYGRLSPPAARLFRLLGRHAGADFTVPDAARLAGLSVPESRRSLAELTRNHLLTEAIPGRYACHDLLRAYAAEQAYRIDGGTGAEWRHGRRARYGAPALAAGG